MFVNVKLFKIKSLKKKKKQDTRPVQVPGQGKQSASLDGKRDMCITAGGGTDDGHL